MPQHLVAAAAAVRRRTEQHLVLSASVRPKYRARRHVRTRLQDIDRSQGTSHRLTLRLLLVGVDAQELIYRPLRHRKALSFLGMLPVPTRSFGRPFRR